jgi:hypothetical protein
MRRIAVLTAAVALLATVPALASGSQSVKCGNQPKKQIWALTGPSCKIANKVTNAVVVALVDGKFIHQKTLTVTVSGQPWRATEKVTNQPKTVSGRHFSQTDYFSATNADAKVTFQTYSDGAQ